MAYGDVGGPVTELVVTCQTPASGTIAITKGDAVRLTGAYEVNNNNTDEDAVFGQAMASASYNSEAIPIKVRGIAIFPYTGESPAIGEGVIASADYPGNVKGFFQKGHVTGNIVIKVTQDEVHVLL